MRAASARSRRDGLWASPSAGDDPMGTSDSMGVRALGSVLACTPFPFNVTP